MSDSEPVAFLLQVFPDPVCYCHGGGKESPLSGQRGRFSPSLSLLGDYLYLFSFFFNHRLYEV